MNHGSPHSFPNRGSHRVCVARYLAEGGPVAWARPGLAMASDEPVAFKLTPLDQQIGWGRYRAARIPWGAALRETRGRVLAQVDGRWRDVETFAGVTRDDICALSRSDLNGEVGVPARWVFNDRYKTTLYEFVDDHSEYLHEAGLRHGPAPIEASASPLSSSSPWAGSLPAQGDVGAEQGWCDLPYRHGRLHLRDSDFKAMLSRGYIADGVVLVVHPDPERSMQTAGAPSWSHPPYELHFYPRDRALFVYGWVREGRNT